MRSGVLAAAIVVAAHLAILFIVSTAGPPAVMWGVNSWSYLDLQAAALLGVACLAAAFIVYRAPAFPVGLPGRLAVVLAGGGLFVLLRDRTHLLGDGRLWISVLGGPRAYHPHEPLAFAVPVLATTGVEGATSGEIAARFEIYSAILGMAALGLMLVLAARLAATDAGRWLVLGGLLASATVQFGFGYIEAYPLLWTTVLAYFAVSLHALRAGVAARAYPAAVLLALAASTHGIGFLLVPSFLYLLWALGATRREWAGTAVVAGAIVLGAYAGIPRMMPAAGGEPPGFEGTVQGLLQLFGGFRAYPHGWGHWILDHVNRWTLIAPLAPGLLLCASLLRAFRKDRPLPEADEGGGGAVADRWFFGFAALGLATPILLIDTEGSRGAALDWDAFAVAAVPLILLGFGLWTRPAAGSRGLRAVLAGGVAAALWGSGGFIAVNASPEKAIERYEDLLESPRWTARTRAMAAETLGSYFREAGDLGRAASWYARGAELDPGNTRLVRNAAVLQSRTGHPRRAVDLYLSLAQGDPGDAGLWRALGRELEAVGAADSAAVAYRRVLRIDPQSVETHNRLARLLLRPGARREARVEATSLLRRSLELDPEQPLASELLQLLEALQASEP